MISPKEEKSTQRATAPRDDEMRKLSVHSTTSSAGSERKHRKSSRTHHGSSLNEVTDREKETQKNERIC